MNVIDSLLDLRNNCGKTEEELLARVKNPIDENASWLGHDSYLTYYALGFFFKPTSILEIGSRYGYSLESMRLGSGQLKHVFSFDSGYDFADSCDYIREKFGTEGLDTLNVTKVNTRYLTDLELPMKVDLAHVDAEHSIKGTYEDCILAFKYLKQGGVLLIDDVGTNSFSKFGSDLFCRKYGHKSDYLPCYRGMNVIIIN